MLINAKANIFFNVIMLGLVKGAKLCFRCSYFYFHHGESTSPASQKIKDLNKVSLPLMTDSDLHYCEETQMAAGTLVCSTRL